MLKKQMQIIDNLNSIIEVLFHQVSISDVLEERIVHNAVYFQLIADLMHDNKKISAHYNRLECEQIAIAAIDHICDRADFRMGHTSIRNNMHVFDLLAEIVEAILAINNDVVCCRYSMLMEWRRLTNSIGEEIPVTVMYALRDMHEGKTKRKNFSWNFVIKQNNTQLNSLLSEGFSEHHFHLWGSTPYFQVSWINLMNQVINNQYSRNLAKLDKKYRVHYKNNTPISYYCNEKNRDVMSMDSLEIMHLQAALIRLYLCARISNISLEWTKKRDNAQSELEYVIALLKNPYGLLIESNEIQSTIASFAFMNKEVSIDYACYFCRKNAFFNVSENAVFSGERWFIYSIVKDIFASFPILNSREHNLFYAYLLIQTKLRTKMVQVNDKVGFDNFQNYQNKKNFFLNDDITSTQMIARMAIRESLVQNPAFLELEARISPERDAFENSRSILELENAILKDNLQEKVLASLNDSNDLKKRYYYVFHFIKEKDVVLEDMYQNANGYEEKEHYPFEYRHYSLRKKLEKQTMGIMEFREQYPQLAERVRGIDACSQEIGCRPENFASIFRILNHHVCIIHDCDKTYTLPQLKKTYHVGEDFLDVTDGLRSIDEAVRFLNLDCGDRLGHALALGTNVEEWYHSKKYQITLTIQDYLDNLAWLYHVLQRYSVPEMDNLLYFLNGEFEHYFKIVYRNHMKDDDLNAIMEEGKKFYTNYYNEFEQVRNYQPHRCNFSIEEYYRAWTLRGDHPDLYQNGYYCTKKQLDDWGHYKTNWRYPRRFDIRYIPECSLLYYYYHYNTDVKREGQRFITVNIRNNYVQGVKAVQKALQFDIARRGLSIETNPTSNALIGMFREYQKHPIITLYNRGLAHTKDELHECPQINVSINTDDSGVFFTCLENEYALMAYALENTVDEYGKPLYNKEEIKEWLDNIRKIGNAQGF